MRSKEQHVLLVNEKWVVGTASVLQVLHVEHGELEVILSIARNIGGGIGLPRSVTWQMDSMRLSSSSTRQS